MRGIMKLGVMLVAAAMAAQAAQSAVTSGTSKPVAPRKAPDGSGKAVLSGDVLAKADLAYYWKFRLDLDAGERIERVWRIDELMYCLTNQRKLIAVDARRGLPAWAQIIGTKETIFEPVHADAVTLRPSRAGMKEMLQPKAMPPVEAYNAAFINTLSTVTVINRSSGKLVKIIPLTFSSNAGGETDGTYFYGASTAGNYYAVRMNAEVDSWEMSTSDMISAPVRLLEGTVFVGSKDKTLTAAVGASQRKRKWIRAFDAPITAPFVVDRRGIFLGTQDGRIHIIDRANGERMKVPDVETKAFKDWGPVITKGEIVDPIQVGASSIFQYVRKDAFYAIGIDSAKPRWTNPDGRSVAAIFGTTLALLDKNNVLLMVHESDGKIQASLPMTGWDLVVPNTQIEAIYAASSDGTVCCIRRKSAPALTDKMLNPNPVPGEKK
ncbi:MAG: PQQ-like beta-propeller repeat protein [Planctomycetaceae bacterium]|nr:PQQ-like beta-propeller repeat protein [Planctomycetaceae bacterium]